MNRGFILLTECSLYAPYRAQALPAVPTPSALKGTYVKGQLVT